MFFNRKKIDNNEINFYKDYITKKNNVSILFDQTIKCIDFLNIKSIEEELYLHKNKLDTEVFKVLIIGSFKNGKSTFINSLLGKEILPAYSTPCTAVINEIKYGETPKAVIHFKSDINQYDKEYLLKIPEFIHEHINNYSKGEIPPIEIPWDKLEDYVVIPAEVEDQKRGIQESPYEKVELYYPLTILKNGIEIIDSPGINESDTHTRIAQNYVRNSDAIIFVFNSLAIFSQAEQDFLEEEILNKGFKDVICVINRFDQLASEVEQKRIKDFTENKIAPLTNLGDNGIFFTSAQNGLMGKIENNNEKYENSGIKNLEKYLAEFLINQRGNLKLRQPSEELKRIISNSILEKELPVQTQLMDNSLQELIVKQKEIEPEIQSLNIKKEDVEKKLSIGITEIKEKLIECVEQYYIDIDSKLETAVIEYEPSEKISLMHMKKQSTMLGEEICNYLQDFIVNEQRLWAEQSFQPLFTELLKNWLCGVEQNLNDFYLKIDAIKISANDVIVSSQTVPLWQRALGVAAGALLGCWDVALMGGIGGLNLDLFKTLAIELAATMTLYFVGFLNPVTILGIAVIGIIGHGFTVGKRLERQVKNKVLEQVIKSLHDNKDDVVNTLIQSCTSEMEKIQNIIITNMNNEITNIQERLDNIIKEKEKGDSKIKAYKKKIELCNEVLNKILRELENNTCNNLIL